MDNSLCIGYDDSKVHGCTKWPDSFPGIPVATEGAGKLLLKCCKQNNFFHK